jgi:serine/threonine protein kinase
MSATHPNAKLGMCPVCEAEGPVGTPCGQPACARRGYHFIPAEHMPPDRTGPIDPVVGIMMGEHLVVSYLGGGGFARVYLAIEPRVMLRAAVKILDLEWTPEMSGASLRGRFEAEARALALVQHPNVVRLLRYGEHRGRPFLVMEYVDDAVTLEADVAARVHRGERYSIAEVRAIVRQILDGLGAVHESAVIHRDVKPGNLLLQQARGYPLFVRILDFGLAKFLESGNLSQLTSGTPDYMAPEQLAREALGPWTDLYAVGTIAFELLTGRRPFAGSDMQRTFFLKMSRDFDPTAAVAHLSLPAATIAFLRRSVARDPMARHANADDMTRDLERALDALEARPGDPLAGVTLSTLEGVFVDEGGPAGATPSGEPPDARRRSEEAFQRWIERESARLGMGGPGGREGT